MPRIEIGEATFQRLVEKAQSQGFSDLSSYLDDLADDGFIMTPETEAALEVGLEDIRQGRVVSLEESRRSLEAHKAEWRAGRT